MEISKTALLRFLKTSDSILYGKALEVHDKVVDWLGYIPESFPHYTRHTIGHSEAIIFQLSQIFFKKSHSKPNLDLSPMEAYILVCAAYFHDAGMVISNKEKEQILQSPQWINWTSGDGPATARWESIRLLRTSPDLSESLRNFIADVQVRFLVAEFVRRFHHVRGKELIELRENEFAQFAFGDEMLKEAIGNVCMAHGLPLRDLEDRDRFPERREIRGDSVNLRFLAHALRVGDLLDMSNDRACSLLLNAACPLPPESYAHWSQYKRIKHRLTAPDEIQIEGYCENQEEHRFLHDWCDWLVKEVDNWTVASAHGSRHEGWIPPKATISVPGATIRIEPSRTASYIPSNWRFELDADLVFERLITDVYSGPASFIRELIQNSLDALRSQMYLDLVSEHQVVPIYPTQVSENIRNKYKLRLSKTTKEVPNDVSGNNETRQFLTIEDTGLGMDEDVIKRFLLQVGRSFYTTNEYKKKFKFAPTSRFGIGFLSVFNASDKIKIDTYKSSSAGARPLSIELTRPRNYLLLQNGDRPIAGTKIELMLKNFLGPGELRKHALRWCKFVEFPISINEDGADTAISQDHSGKIQMEWVAVGGSRFFIRSFDLNRVGLEGLLFVFAYETAGAEYWDRWHWSQSDYLDDNPAAVAPTFPTSYICLHGVSVESDRTPPMGYRVDYRDNSIAPNLARERSFGLQGDTRINSRWAEILDNHIKDFADQDSDEHWRYRQRLAGTFKIPGYWKSVAMIPFRTAEGLTSVSLHEALCLDGFTTCFKQGVYLRYPPHYEEKCPPEVYSNAAMLLGSDLERINHEQRRGLFENFQLGEIKAMGGEWILLYWKRSPHPGYEGTGKHTAVYINGNSDKWFGQEAHKTIDAVYPLVIINRKHKLGLWLSKIKTTEGSGRFESLARESYSRLITLSYEAIHYRKIEALTSFLSKWNRIAGIPRSLLSPVEEISPAEVNPTDLTDPL